MDPVPTRLSSDTAPSLRFILDGQICELPGVAPTRTVLQVLREDLGRTGTKEGCAEGDCGACTVVLGERTGRSVRYRAVNACIQFAPTLDGKALFTVESLRCGRRSPHPVQAALVDAHGSQCGFCTPGFVMSLFALYKSREVADRATIADALSGNLCRCTGYRPIIDAAQAALERPRMRTADEVDVTDVRAGDQSAAANAVESKLVALLRSIERSGDVTFRHSSGDFHAPRTLTQLAQLRAALPDARLLAGGTDVALWVTKQLRSLGTIIYVGRVDEMMRIDATPTYLEIGAAVTVADALKPLVTHFPDFRELLRRYGSPPIRNAATLGGNIANGSPIGDSMPGLIALGASVVLHRAGKDRELPLEAIYVGYQKTVLVPGEFLRAVRVPLPDATLAFRTYKISKRFDQDISSLCAAFAAHIVQGRIVSVRIAFGGMAATPMRANKTEEALAGRPWTEATVRAAQNALDDDFTPISDMRSSAAYRRLVARNLLFKFWIETNGLDGRRPTRLYDLRAVPK